MSHFGYNQIRYSGSRLGCPVLANKERNDSMSLDERMQLAAPLRIGACPAKFLKKFMREISPSPNVVHV